MLSRKLLPTFVFLLLFLHAHISAQERNVLIEYCAGTWCASCPLAAEAVQNDILPAYPNTIVLAYHGWAGSPDPFSDFEGNDIIDLLSFNSYPTGRIDRATDALPDYHWLENVEPRSEIPAKVDINCNVSFDTLSRKVALTVSAYPIFDDIKEECNLTVVLVEDGIVYPQQVMGDSLVDYNYVHNNVVRKVVSSVLGDTLNSGEIWGQGNVIEREYSIDIDESYDFRNCRIVAFVHYNEKELFRGEILQAESKKIYDQPSLINDAGNTIDGFELFQNYPNPFGKRTVAGESSTRIKFVIPENRKDASFFVMLTIYDLLGRKITEPVNGNKRPGNYEVLFNAQSVTGGLAPGVYFYTLNICDNSNKLIFSSTKKMLLNR